MKFFIFSLSTLFLLLVVTIILGVYTSFSPLIISGLVIVSIAIVALLIIFIKNSKQLINKNKENKKDE